MNRYTTIKQLGDGTYGSVLLGRSIDSGELIAIKKMKRKFYSWEECMNLREVKSLKKLNHANIVKLKEVIRENDHLYFVFEYMKENLYQLMKERNKLFPESTVRNIMYQILQGLAFIHKHGFFHRDLKPENLLCMGPELVKIADFGLAREIRSRPPYTDYVSTRWYRAPEVLLRSTSYSSPIDIWAVGCIMAEVYTLRPLFPGASEIDTIFKICQVLGTPKKALRYPYFQVGHALGTSPCIQELGKQPKELHDEAALHHVKPVPPAQPPPKPHVRLSSRPFQQSQSSQYLMYPYKADCLVTDHVTQLREDEPAQVHLPALRSQVPQQKIPIGTENTNGELKPKTRRRWGHITRIMKGSEEWDDLEDFDFSSSLTRTDLKNKRRQSDEALCRFESILDLKLSDNLGSGNSAPSHVSFPRQDTPTLRVSAAKQHYLKHSRYLPGISTRNSIVSSSSKDSIPSKPWPTSNLPGKASGVGGGVNGMNSEHSGSSRLTGGYVSSFLKKEIGSAGQRVQLAPVADSSSNYASLKSVRPHVGRPSFNTPSKSTPALMPRPPPIQPIHGRTDWSSKYGAHR
ncbi:serine/threonine-protein kinase ICK isoform X3 [Dermochelys coriacea]|uniref:serine/threonine-protein kinase ICK isoform X3 n=1 Tax=Dermochelys coriacea TaxID=27794 RepID=UPI001CA89895|nr:serine/threonine-protein kinase ICK isoform X3 [Dermochelys coriacea]